jgi:predicted Fe-Mo cluster-binding NifX family protein
LKNEDGVKIVMAKFRIAVATNGKKELDDTVSNVFGRAKTFTIIDVDNEKVISLKVLENPALSYSHGAGPIAIKTLIDDGVKIVIANDLGIGASEILANHKIKHVQARPGTNVKDAVDKALNKMK